MMGQTTLYHADLLPWLRGRLWLVENGFIPKFHAAFFDPPYFLGSISKRFGKPGSVPAKYGSDGAFSRASRGFMGKQWDGFESVWHYQAWVTEWASLMLGFLYPGAVIAVFGGTRTYHRIAAGLEDAGFEVFDQICYMYGSGFPKSHDISKAIDRAAGAERDVIRPQSYELANDGGYSGGLNTNKPRSLSAELSAPSTPDAIQWDGYGTALKPAYEPIILARAPRGKHTFADLARQYGSGALNVDGCRINVDGDDPNKRGDTGGYKYEGDANGFLPFNSTRGATLVVGRWPANIILDEHAAELLDQQSGELNTGGPVYSTEHNSDTPSNFLHGITSKVPDDKYSNDSGGASRFFYTAKSATWEREAGLHHREQTTVNDGRKTPIDNPYQRGETKRRNTHPTVKPIRLNEYIARLLLPPVLNEPRRILIPFGGVGSEVIGALLAGWDQVVSIEREAEYIPLHRERVSWWQGFKSYEQAESAYKADIGEENQRDNERAHGLEQLSIFDAITQEG